MNVRVKLFAQLGRYLPAGADRNEADMDVADGVTPAEVFRLLDLPAEYCHLVLVNGVFVPPGERTRHKLEDGDHLAAWPPVAGGSPKPSVVEKEMGVTHGDFFRTIARALGNDDFKKKPDGVVLENGGKRLEITLGPERQRRIANLRIPATDVTLSFSGYTDAERAAQLDLFDRMFQKGGG